VQLTCLHLAGLPDLNSFHQVDRLCERGVLQQLGQRLFMSFLVNFKSKVPRPPDGDDEQQAYSNASFVTNAMT